ncbi:MAG: thymidine kinase [Paenibacillus sp.]|nr:thymidine kinase [Paenibacillus sp.]
MIDVISQQRGLSTHVAKLYFRYGTMNSGKSIEVLRTAHNYEEQGKKVLLFTPSVDDRYGVGTVASRIGMQKHAIIIDDQINMIELAAAEKPNCILIDESQFLNKEQVQQLAEIVDSLNIPVIAYGLRADFLGNLFEGSYHLLAIADKIEEIKTVCWFCDKKAIMNMRCNDGNPVFEGEQIQIGGNESYLPVCRKCYASKRKQAHML